MRGSMYNVYCDGASRGNGGDSAASFIITSINDDVEILSRSEYIGCVTNNVAEYMAIKNAAIACKESDFDNLKIISDSMLAIRQLSGEWKVKNKELKSIRNDVKRITDTFEFIYFEWRPREDPMLQKCDFMNNKCLDHLNNL